MFTLEIRSGDRLTDLLMHAISRNWTVPALVVVLMGMAIAAWLRPNSD